MLLSSTTVNGAVSNDSNNNITMSVGNTVIANVNSSGIALASGTKVFYTGAMLQTAITSYAGSGLTAHTATSTTTTGVYGTITTTQASSSILVSIYLALNPNAPVSSAMYIGFPIYRNSTQINTQYQYRQGNVSTGDNDIVHPMVLMDSPGVAAGTTLTYTLYYYNVVAGQSFRINDNVKSLVMLQEIAA